MDYIIFILEAFYVVLINTIASQCFFFFLHRSQVRAKGRTQVADSGKGGRGSLLLLLTRFQKRPLKAAGPGIVSFLIVMDCQ